MSEAEKRINQRQINDVKWVLSTEQGRRFMWRILSYCGIYRDVEGEDKDIMKQLGKRQVGLYLLGVLSDIDDEKVFDMMREAKNIDMEDNYVRAIEERNNRDEDDDYGRDDYIDSSTGNYGYSPDLTGVENYI